MIMLIFHVSRTYVHIYICLRAVFICAEKCAHVSAGHVSAHVPELPQHGPVFSCIPSSRQYPHTVQAGMKPSTTFTEECDTLNNIFAVGGLRPCVLKACLHVMTHAGRCAAQSLHSRVC